MTLEELEKDTREIQRQKLFYAHLKFFMWGLAAILWAALLIKKIAGL